MSTGDIAVLGLIVSVIALVVSVYLSRKNYRLQANPQLDVNLGMTGAGSDYWFRIDVKNHSNGVGIIEVDAGVELRNKGSRLWQKFGVTKLSNIEPLREVSGDVGNSTDSVQRLILQKWPELIREFHDDNRNRKYVLLRDFKLEARITLSYRPALADAPRKKIQRVCSVVPEVVGELKEVRRLEIDCGD